MKYLFTPFFPPFAVFGKKLSRISDAIRMNIIKMAPYMLLFSLVSAGPAFGVENQMGEVVVTANRYQEEVKDIPANVTVITEKDINNSTAQNIPELLRDQVGVQVSDITGSHRYYTVDLRGFGETAGSNTLVLVDGRRVNEADLSGTDWTQIPLSRVERIEIVRGGRGAVLYGDNASGGVVNIITREGNKSSAGVSGSAGSYGTYKGSAHVSGRLNSLSYAVSGTYLNSDGYRDNSKTKAKDAGLDLSYYPGNLVRLNFSSGYHKNDSGLPGSLFENQLEQSRTQSLHPDDFARVKDYYFKAGPEIYFRKDSSFKLDASYRKRHSLTFASFSGGEFTGDTGIKTLSVSPRLLLKSNMGNAGNTLTIGYDYEDAKENITNDSLFFGSHTVGNFNFEKKNYGIYVNNEFVALNNITLSAGYRYDKADFQFDPGSPGSVSVNENLYTLGINYKYRNKSYCYMSYARSFRYPLFDEYFSFFTNTVNTGLTPQTSRDYEIGVRHYFTDVSYAHINIFRIETDREIFYNPVTYANENIDGKTRRDGVELSFNAGFFDWLAFNGSYTYTDAGIRGGQFKGNDFPGVPRHKATLGTVLSSNGASLALNGVYTGKRRFISDFSNSFTKQKDYTVLNAKFRYKWKKLSAFLDINNLTDKEYSEYGVIGFNMATFSSEKAFYPSPGRNYLFGVSLDI
ncbi:MAG TPA: TonB-dependent receptor [Nitrospirae bacterium]|nr:colicin I receptor precursor [bacterium BMS3Bbin05]HDO22591.1 TonB-dependent receptor [Nitrospirota bacterium]HDO36080.1 TonB-dependent receptor [Nitrospirota bacterium]HDZ88920.1 TonB-dependent receptor [Nitrospirota bacterium]